jgi:hypothetical protein
MKKETEKLLTFAEALQNKLLQNGFVVHRYDAISTNSIYLKLDYGAANSIRISDHRGKHHLQYRYNVGTQIKKYRADKSGQYPRFYYPMNQMNVLLKHILESREQKIRKYGKGEYNAKCLQYKSTSQDSPGFWQDARLIGGEV